MKSIQRSPLSILSLYQQGQEKITEEREAEEEGKQGTLRGGHTGCVTEAGEVVGKCHRLAHLRSLGIQESPTHRDKLMFEAGFANEDIWVDVLSRSWQGAIICEEDIPTEWMTINGTKVTGRPDLVLCEQSGEEYVPKLGLELKLVSSPWSAYNKVVKEIPDIEHICQAAHYMWQLNVPYKLCYTSRANYSVGYGGMKSNWQKKGQYLNDQSFKALPFILEVDMWVENGVVWYQGWDSDPVETPITIDGIKEYYERASQIGERKSLGPRPVGRYADGSAKEATKSQCADCSFADICDTYEADYDRWVDEIKRKILTEEDI